MDIGGYDLVFDTPDPKGLAGKIMSFVNWPDAVTEPDGKDDFFWYEDAKAKESWDRDGAVPELEDTMLYFLFHEGQLTVVADKAMADSVRSFVEGLGR